ncbi:MAG: pilus assembly protein PilY, partial [Haliea sp.]
TFFNTYQNRTPTLFVGANDGMLHAFNATNGAEVFAYIPSWMGPKLSALTTDNYITNHQSYVDATPAVGEAELGTDWKTVLVGGTGAGGQGVYALDVTAPSAFDASKVLWEFTDRDDVSMGNVIGQPQIRKFRISAPGVSPAVYKWFAVVASGVNHYVADGFDANTANPSIFLLDLAKAKGTPWALGTNYYKLSFPINTTLGRLAPGLANFETVNNLQGEVRYLYAGDLHGQMWKLDFTRPTVGVADWTVANLSSFRNGTTPLPLFVAKDANGVPQPITNAPFLAGGPRNSTLVVFGTGKYLESSDNVVTSTTQVQSLYTLYDDGTTANDTASPAANTGAISGRGRLMAGSAGDTGTVTVATFTYGKASSDTDLRRSGWYIDFPRDGEKQISAGDTVGRQLIFGTVVPPSSATQVCGTGSGNQYTLDILTGKGGYVVSDVGLLGPPIVFDTGDGIYSASDSTGRRTKTRTSQIVLQGSS